MKILFLVFRFLLMESFVVLSTYALYYKMDFPILTCLSLVFCAGFFLGRIDLRMFSKVKNND